MKGGRRWRPCGAVWDKAQVIIRDDEPEGIRLSRPYAQVNRIVMKNKLLRRCVEQGVVFGWCSVQGVAHENGGSVVRVQGGAVAWPWPGPGPGAGGQGRAQGRA